MVRPRTPKKWAEVTVATTSFGHGIAVTPLQFVDAVGGLVRDGTRVPPTLLKRDPGAIPPSTRYVSEQTAELLRWLMWLAVEHGTGTQANLDSYEIGGKTGTAEKPIGGRYSLDSVLASFVAAFPIDAPRYVVFATLDEPKGDASTYGLRYGGWTAAPVVAAIIDRIGPMLGIPPSDDRRGGGVSREAGEAAPGDSRNSRGGRRALRLAALCDDRLAPARQRRGRDRRPSPRLARGSRRRPVRGDAGHAHRRRPVPAPTRGRAGAVAVLGDARAAAATDLPALVAEEPRAALARVAARFFGRQPRTVVAVTGTSGKSSVAVFTRQLWAGLGHPAASLGTLGLQTSDAPGDGSLTTPDPITLHRIAAELADAGIEHLALEASSHGLDQHRVDGLRFAAAAFTNLSRDHFDYHGSAAAYYAAKRRLFAELLPPGGRRGPQRGRPGVRRPRRARGRPAARASSTMASGRRRCGWCAARLPRTAWSSSSSCWAAAIASPSAWSAASRRSNLLAAAGLVLAGGATVEALAAAAGRPARTAGPDAAGGPPSLPAPPAFVDYAHKPEALAKALEALRPAHRRSPGRGVRLRRRPRCRQAAADGRDRAPGSPTGSWSPTTTRAPRTPVRSGLPCSPPPRPPARSAAGARRSAPRSPTCAPGTRCWSPARGMRPTRSSATEALPFDDAEVLRDAARAAGGRAS